MRIFSGILAAAYLGAGVGLTVLIPKFMRIFADLFQGQPVPGLTQSLLQFPPYTWAVFGVLCGAAILAKDTLPNLPRYLLNSFFTLALVLITGYAVIALFLPLIPIIESLEP